MFKRLFFERPTQGFGVSLGILALRLVAGAAFMLHGLPKIQNPTGWMGENPSFPLFLVAAAAVSEFFGGVCWFFGVFTFPFSVLILATMGVAVRVHMAKGDPFVGFNGSYELALVYFAVALFLTLAGPGKFSVDAWLHSKTGKSK